MEHGKPSPRHKCALESVENLYFPYNFDHIIGGVFEVVNMFNSNYFTRLFALGLEDIAMASGPSKCEDLVFFLE